MEKGRLASLKSVDLSSSHRSGLKANGSWKYSGLCVTLQALVYISAYIGVDISSYTLVPGSVGTPDSSRNPITVYICTWGEPREAM